MQRFAACGQSARCVRTFFLNRPFDCDAADASGRGAPAPPPPTTRSLGEPSFAGNAPPPEPAKVYAARASSASRRCPAPANRPHEPHFPVVAPPRPARRFGNAASALMSSCAARSVTGGSRSTPRSAHSRRMSSAGRRAAADPRRRRAVFEERPAASAVASSAPAPRSRTVSIASSAGKSAPASTTSVAPSITHATGHS